MNCGPTTIRRDGLVSACTTRERRTRSQQPTRPRTAAGRENERSVNRALPVKKNTWLQRAKVYENSFIAMKNKKVVKKQTSRDHIPQAYDIEEHLDCSQGVVVIGKNGVLSNDKYYVKCMRRSKPEPSTGSDVDSSFLSSEDEYSVDINHDKIPLCWKQQLQDKDVVRICQPTTNVQSSDITKPKSQRDKEIPVVKESVGQEEDTKKKVEHHPFLYIMLSWGKVCILEWKDCLSSHIHPKPNGVLKDNVVDEIRAHLPSLEVLLDHIKEYDHSLEWRHINSTLCIWLSWSHINKDYTYDVYVTDNAPSVSTRAFSGVKSRIVYDNVHIIHFNLVKSLPWITNLSEIQGKQFNITISRCNPLLRTEVKLLCEDVRLGTAFEDNWCNPRGFPNLISQINSIEDLDEDKTDLLAISDFLPDLLKFSPNSSLDTSQDTNSEMKGNKNNSHDQPNHKGILITQKSLVWQNSTVPAGYSSKALLQDKGHLLNTELALSRTIRNYNNKRYHSQVTSKGLNTLVRPSALGGYKATHRQWQHTKTSKRPQTSAGHKKSSAASKTAKVRPFSAVPLASTNTAKDLELLTKSIYSHLSIKDNLQ